MVSAERRFANRTTTTTYKSPGDGVQGAGNHSSRDDRKGVALAQQIDHESHQLGVAQHIVQRPVSVFFGVLRSF